MNLEKQYKAISLNICRTAGQMITDPPAPDAELITDLEQSIVDLQGIQTYRQELWEACRKLTRENIVSLLESVSIACYDHEDVEELRIAVRENVLDGTLDRDALDVSA